MDHGMEMFTDLQVPDEIFEAGQGTEGLELREMLRGIDGLPLSLE